MSLPDILPTGAMSSGVYVDYMLGYIDTACDYVSTALDSYWGDSTIDGWYDKWDRITDDIDADITVLNSSLTTIKAQIRMIDDAINKL